LEGARQPDLRHFMRLQAGKRGTVEHAAAFLGDIQAGQHVEQRGLAGAVRADQAIDFACLYVEADIAQGAQAPEPLAQAFGFQDSAHAWPPVWVVSSRLRTAEGHSPAGRNSMTHTMARPNSSMRMPSGSSTTSPNTSRCRGSRSEERRVGQEGRGRVG